MLEAAWIFIGRIAFVWTVLTVLAAVYVDADNGTGDGLATIGGVVGFVLWGVWSFGALNVAVVKGGRVSADYFSQPELALIGVAMALVPGYIALTGPIELINRARQPEMRDI